MLWERGGGTVAHHGTQLGSESTYMKEAPRSFGIVCKIAGIDPFIDYHCNPCQILPHFFIGSHLELRLCDPLIWSLICPFILFYFITYECVCQLLLCLSDILGKLKLCSCLVVFFSLYSVQANLCTQCTPELLGRSSHVQCVHSTACMNFFL